MTPERLKEIERTWFEPPPPSFGAARCMVMELIAAVEQLHTECKHLRVDNTELRKLVDRQNSETAKLEIEVERLRKVQETPLTDGNALAKRVEAFRAGLKQLLVNDLAIRELDYTLEPDEVENRYVSWDHTSPPGEEEP